MKKLFENGWITLAMMLLVAIADLIALPTKIQFGAGWVLAFFYFLVFIVFLVFKPSKDT